MSHGAGDHDWDHKLACVIRQRSTHISADAGASYPLAELLGKHDIHAQIEHLSYQIGGARSCELPNLQESLQIIGLGNPVFDQNVAGHAGNASKVVVRFIRLEESCD